MRLTVDGSVDAEALARVIGVPDLGECFTMLTTEPGSDIAPYHHRQIVVLGRDDWARWLDPAVPAVELLQATPMGTLEVARVR